MGNSGVIVSRANGARPATCGAAYSASYTSDRLARLASVTEGSYSTIFGVWTTGTEATIPGQPRHAPRYIGNPSNQFGYDPAGNMTIRWLRQGGSYTAYAQKFNVDNRLYQVTGNGTTITYDLDAHTGTTLRRTQTSGSTTTVTDFVRQYYQKNVTTGAGTVSYYFGDRLVAQLSNKRTFLHGDHLGSTVLVTDGQGGVAGRYRYHAYGRQREGSSSTERRFTGQRVEGSSSLYDYQARHYDPALGIFVSPDTIVPEPGRPAALNRFAYGYNNPSNLIDPDGHDPRKPQPGQSVTSYILSEMHTNARSFDALAIQISNYFGNTLVGVGSGIDTILGTSPMNGWATVASSELKGIGAGHKSIAYKLWYDKVRYNGDWDHKSVILAEYKTRQWVPDAQGRPLFSFSFDVWSNIHYGFVGAHAGFGMEELLGGAGAAQFKKSFGESNYWEAIRSGEVGPHTFFDWPADQAAIALGIYLYYKYGLELTEEQLLQAVREWESLDREGPIAYQNTGE